MKHDVKFTPLNGRNEIYLMDIFLIWLVHKFRPVEIDKIISAEIPDPNVDQELFDIVTINMVPVVV